MHKFEDYKIEITPLTKEDGGGFLVTFPDLPGCMADGETLEEAIVEAKDAFSCWVKACLEWEKNIPAPGSGGTSGRFVTRVPKTLHAKLAARAKQEGAVCMLLFGVFLSFLGTKKCYLEVIDLLLLGDFPFDG